MIQPYSWIRCFGRKSLILGRCDDQYRIAVLDDNNDYDVEYVFEDQLHEIKINHIHNGNVYVFTGNKSKYGATPKGTLVTLVEDTRNCIYHCLIESEFGIDRALPFDLQPINY